MDKGSNWIEMLCRDEDRSSAGMNFHSSDEASGARPFYTSDSAHKIILLFPLLIMIHAFEIHSQMNNSILNIVTSHAFEGYRKREK